MARTYRQKSPPLRFFLTIFLPAVSFEDHRSSKETGNLEVAASEGKCHRRGGGRRRADLSKKISNDLFSSNRGMETMNTYKDVFFPCASSWEKEGDLNGTVCSSRERGNIVCTSTEISFPTKKVSSGTVNYRRVVSSKAGLESWRGYR